MISCPLFAFAIKRARLFCASRIVTTVIVTPDLHYPYRIYCAEPEFWTIRFRLFWRIAMRTGDRIDMLTLRPMLREC